MITEKDFIDYYKKISNEELLAVLDNPKDYETVALKIAELEFLSRQLTEEEIIIARQPQIKNQLLRGKREQKALSIENQIKNTDSTVLTHLDKSLLVFIILFFLVAIFQIASNYNLLKYSIILDLKRSPLLTFVIAFPIIILPIALIVFWNRKRIGWILFAVYLTFCATDSILVLVQSFTIDSIIRCLFFIGALLFICKQNILDVYSINRKKKDTTIIATLFLTLATFLIVIMW